MVLELAEGSGNHVDQASGRGKSAMAPRDSRTVLILIGVGADKVVALTSVGQQAAGNVYCLAPMLQSVTVQVSVGSGL